jgi:methionine-rich copper-binding protein CopC
MEGCLIRLCRQRSGAPCALVAVLLLLAPSFVLGHALLVDSSPKQDEVIKEAPAEVVLRFNARIEKSVSRVTLLGPDGGKVKLPPLPEDKDGSPDRLKVDLPALKPGAYKLEFRVLASDGHTTPGLLRFTVSAPSGGGAGGSPGGAGK